MKVRDKTLLVFCITVIALIILSALILAYTYNAGLQVDLLQSLFLIFGLGLAFGITMLSVLDRLILQRVGTLTDAVNDIGLNRSVTGRVTFTGDDELTGLAHSINRMLAQLESADQRLRESELRYHAIIEDQTEFISRFLPDGTHIFANEAYCRYFGKRCSEIIGKKFSPEIPPEDRRKLREYFASFSSEQPVLSIEHRMIMPDGDLRWQHWTDRAIYGADGTITEFQSVGRDITDRKRTEEVLHQANQKLNILGSVTRHDVINLIQGLRSYLELSVDLNREASISGYLAKAADISLRIQKLIEFTKDYQNMGVKEPRWHPVEQLVRDVGVNFPSIFLVTRVPGLEIFADPLLEKVFYNLMDNSIRHGDHVTIVTIYHALSDNGLTLVYEDNGQGIPHDEKTRIFRQGYGKNTGYGLFLIQEILALTGMTIRETGEPGTGARFEIHVPRGNYRLETTSKPSPPPVAEGHL